MKLCINTLIWPDLSLEQALAAAASVTDIRTVELGATYTHPQMGPIGEDAQLERLRDIVVGWKVAAVTADHPDFPREVNEGGAAAIAHTVAAVKAASALGAGVVSLSLGATDVDPWERAWDRAMDALWEVLRLTNRTRVRLAVRLHVDDVFDSLNKARRMLATVNDPRLGVALDTGILYYRRIELKEALKVIGPKLFHVHVRDATRGDLHRAIGRGEVGFAAAFRTLRDAEYRGALSVELSRTQQKHGLTVESALAEALPLLQGWLEPANQEPPKPAPADPAEVESAATAEETEA